MSIPMTLIVVALLGLAGLLALALSSNAKVARVGEIVFFVCLLACVLWAVFRGHA